ncbi:MAG TPA: cytochrome c oxidase assembly protein [Planococcus sp. (in: firmicutes)]|nr:cytochrome c oxidase assembly protein [Planococcus sp. (in: firmicutes)]
MAGHGHGEPVFGGFEAAAFVVLAALFVLYPLAALMTGEKYKKWPLHRYAFWGAGLAAIAAALLGPLAELAHSNFTAHMAGHLLLGMLAPLLLLYAKPVTLLLRTLSVPKARGLSRLLKSRPLQGISHPVTAAFLNIGGLYALYLTGLFEAMHQSGWLYAFIHLHVLLAGYLFTMSIIYVDVAPHRYGFILRSAVLILALAAHKILAKLIYATPPASVGKKDGEAGALLMYYGGDAIDLALIIILCYQWYRSAAPRLSPQPDLLK